jgi:hypothetical protein
MALAGALCMVVHAVAGFSNRSLRALVAGLLGTTYTASQMTYDLRRLRRHGLIQRRPGTNTYLPPPTASGWRCSTPRSTTGCWRRCWPPTTHRHHPRSATPYAWSTSRGRLRHQRTPGSRRLKLVTTSHLPAPKKD